MKAHHCPDWDYMLIHEGSMQAEACTCRSFSDFIRNATPEEKEKVYTEVMDRAAKRQTNFLLRRPYGMAQMETEMDRLELAECYLRAALELLDNVQDQMDGTGEVNRVTLVNARESIRDFLEVQ